MKKLVLFAAVFLFQFSAQSQILPNTVHCIKGSDAHPVDYCADLTPCKVKTGPNGTYTVCLAGTPNPPAGALISGLSCWSMTTEYTCLQYVSNCAEYESDAACTEQGSRQCTKGPDSQLMLAVSPKLGQCSAYTRSFSCIDPRKPASSSYTSTTQCDTTDTQNGLDWKTSSQSAADDFIKATTGEEFARQIASYGSKDSNGISNIFPGHPLGCREGWAGLKNCCKSSSGGGAVTNNGWAKNLGMSVAGYGFKVGAGYAASKGSNFVYDSIMTNAPEFMTPGVEDMLSSGSYNSWGSAGFGAYGIGTTAASAGNVVGGMGFGAESSMAIGQTGLYFNPYALAAAIAIQLVMEAISCNQDEKDLANARSQNLCHYVGNYCSGKIKVLGATVGCYETTDTYCCFNGLLGKAVGEGAHSQLGLSWGSPESPNCHGLTPAQLSSLDFDAPAMQSALAPFKQQIMDNYKNNTAPMLANGTIQNSIAGRANVNAQALCLQRQKLDSSTVCN